MWKRIAKKDFSLNKKFSEEIFLIKRFLVKITDRLDWVELHWTRSKKEWFLTRKIHYDSIHDENIVAASLKRQKLGNMLNICLKFSQIWSSIYL